MTSQPHHAMQLVCTFETGAERWICPVCRYQLMMTWPPEYKKIVLVEGDPNAAHSCEKNGLSSARLETMPDKPLPPEFDDIIKRLEGG